MSAAGVKNIKLSPDKRFMRVSLEETALKYVQARAALQPNLDFPLHNGTEIHAALENNELVLSRTDNQPITDDDMQHLFKKAMGQLGLSGEWAERALHQHMSQTPIGTSR
jgi:hypothetical protein